MHLIKRGDIIPTMEKILDFVSDHPVALFLFGALLIFIACFGMAYEMRERKSDFVAKAWYPPTLVIKN